MREALRALAIVVLIALSTSAGEYRPHSPIVIATVADLTPENGVVKGSGTAEDPYVISGWEVDAGDGIGIVVRGVDAYLVIEDCLVRGTPRGTGVSIAGSPHVVVRDCRFEGLGTGVFLYEAPGAVLRGNEFVRCWTGIEGNASPRLLVRENLFRDARKHGLFLWRARGSRLEGNRAFDCGYGIYLDSCNVLTITGNLVVNCRWGIYLWDSHDCLLTRNVVENCVRGLGLYHTSARNLIYHNAFISCDYPAFDDSSGGNRWYAPYPQGGNFWGGVELDDRYSGPEQNEPGPDGIGDVPVEIPEAGRDWYPLMSPPPGLPSWEKGD